MLGFHCCLCFLWLQRVGAAAYFRGFTCGARALGHVGFSSSGAQASLLQGIWNLPQPGKESVSPALADGFLTTVPTREVLKVKSNY